MKLTRKFLLTCLCFLGSILLCGGSAFAITLDISAGPGASLHFAGGTDPYFEFVNNSNGYSFRITGVTNGLGDSVGLSGQITGKFYIENIQGSGYNQWADVTGSGAASLDIFDGATPPFTAHIDWNTIHIYGSQYYVFGSLNIGGDPNLSNISYGGSKNDLLSFLSEQTAILQFSIMPGKTLSDLTTTGGSTSSFSGNLYATPLPPTALLMGSGLLGLLIFARRRKA